MMDLFIADKWTVMQEIFADKLRGIPCSPEAQAYIVGVLAKRRWENDDLSSRSILLEYQEAGLKGDFAAFQRVGDWVLFIDSVMPRHFNGVRECVEAVGRQAYHRCYRLMGTRWRVYEELADELPALARHVHRKLV